jgi:hypothetical protein
MRSHSIDILKKLLMALSLFIAVIMLPLEAAASCASPNNAIEAENCLPGSPDSVWDIPTGDAGDPTIQGFTTNISVNQGETVTFKVNTPARAWHLDIYRMGYYGGKGARLVATVNPSVSLPQSQPACLSDSTTGLTDCGNWAVSASWTVPVSATSGIYFARAVRSDTGGASHIVFIVRSDASHSDILFQASDTAWQAYNFFSPSFYGCVAGAFSSGCRAFKLSYNRPFDTRTIEPETWVFNAEYPMVRWLEANGYDVTYFTDTDTDRHGSLILNHKMWMSNGHDEYWSGNQRTNVEAARAAGVHLAFFSGNAVYWKTRWENSIDGSGTPYRTLVCYKETWANAVIDPADPPTWTGTWRDPRFSPPADGGRPENALKGTLTQIAGGYNGVITVPAADGKMRFWRNTSIATLAAGQTVTLVPGSLGKELDGDADNGFRPPGLFHLTTTTATSPDNYLLDYGTAIGPGTMTHNLTLFRHSSGALVFSAGTYDWAWGLDASHDRADLGTTIDPNMQQATVNLFADMGVQPATLQAGLGVATASTDHTPPTSSIISPASGSSLPVGTAVTITGTATDLGGGVVGGVEISTDGGATWHPATGRESWSYSWTPNVAGPTTVQTRAVDDSGNLQTPVSVANVTVSGTSTFTIWPATTVPVTADVGQDSPVELGVNFRADSNGFITGIRFYRASTNTGTHVGNLWTSTGTLLATATFTSETSSGWQQVNFLNPVAITANTVYVASYHTNVGHYSADANYFVGNGFDRPPLHALGKSASSFNDAFSYGATSTFPNQSFAGTNYWVDVVFTSTAPPPPPLVSITVTPTSQTILTGTTQQFTATGNYSNGSTQNITNQVTWTSSNTNAATISGAGLVAALTPGSTTILAVLGSTSSSTILTVQPGPLTITTTSFPIDTLNLSATSVLDGTGGTGPYTWSISAGSLPSGLTLNTSTGVISGTPTASGSFSFTVQISDSGSPKQTATRVFIVTVVPQGMSLWPNTTVPTIVDAGPDGAVELGVKFSSDLSSNVTGICFYKASTNIGTHVGNLWTSTGTLLATATFTNETASGWQQVYFSTPVAIVANTVYVVSYHTNVGHYSVDSGFFAGKGVDSPPLHAPADGVSGNDGVYAYSSTSIFPSQGYKSSNYWVDVVLQPPTLAITTTSLPGGAVNLSYPATLAAIGGTAPYAWAISSGLLPPGLTLDTSTGAISGTPTTAGTFDFTVQITDSGNPQQTSTRAFSIAIVALASTLWPSTTVPVIVDSGPDGAVELGVKFRSDLSGYITGIRFYKASTNKGTHVANLWSSTGTLLASTTFTAETTSGWQQVNFALPVAITAGTVYVASYHTNVGHYSVDLAYFAAKGVDSASLHALADGISGGDGVYAYGPTSSFPSSTYSSSNYWVDVVFQQP